MGGGGGGGGGQKDLASEARAIHILAIDLKITFKARFVSGKLIIQARLDIQVDASPKVISNDRSILGTTSRGSVSVNDNNPNKVLHFHILGSTDFGGWVLAQQDWGSMNHYDNPPFTLLNKVLNLIQSQKAYATVIVPYWPYWPGQTWC